ncbi:MAG TPA: NAD(P)(+) transhydrogenase (Re/Si-specific) subunit beta, partial [Candidatus Limnocylindria bacterium]|nr:NAD(P)(+) transhydrogenase (Re/Si-specific) subunit beta [Candidatus Limnocylindria bacterium]
MTLLELATYAVYLVASVSFILALKFLASPRTARTGNLLGAGGMALVVAWTIATEPGLLDNLWVLVVGGLVGTVIGVIGARRVPMTAMPQMVAIFNGAGGGAAAVVAVSEFLTATSESGGELLPTIPVIATLLGAVIGSLSLTGSVIAFGKLQGFIAARPVTYPGSRFVAAALLAALLIMAVALAFVTNDVTLFLVFVALAL